MSFSDDFTNCLSPLPPPQQLPQTAADALEFVEQLHQAWENSGGDETMLLVALVAAGAATGIDEAALATAAEVTVTVYVGACLGCLATALGSQVWDLVASNDTPAWAQGELQQQATAQGIAQPSADQATAQATAQGDAQPDADQATAQGDAQPDADQATAQG